MIKRLSLLRFRTDRPYEECLKHWMGPHAHIVRSMPGVRGLRFAVVKRWEPVHAAWDGVGEVWFDSMADAERAFSSPEFLELLTEDRKHFLAEAQWAFVEEHTVIAPAIGKA